MSISKLLTKSSGFFGFFFNPHILISVGDINFSLNSHSYPTQIVTGLDADIHKLIRKIKIIILQFTIEALQGRTNYGFAEVLKHIHGNALLIKYLV